MAYPPWRNPETSIARLPYFVTVNHSLAPAALPRRSSADRPFFARNPGPHKCRENMSTILIVDDSAFQRKIIKSTIGDLVDTILEASNGAAALEAARTHRVECITLDLGLPEMTGFEVLTAFHAQGAHPPVIVITADIQDTSKSRCLALGAHAVLQKPLNKDLVRSVISGVLAATRAN